MVRQSISVLCLLTCFACLAVSLFGEPGGDDHDRPWITRDDSSIPVLIKYLKSENPLAIQAALHDFATRGPKSKPVVPLIRKLQQHPDAFVAIAAAWTMIDLKVEREAALKVIMRAAVDRQPEIREHAAKVLGEVVNPPFSIQCWGPGPRPFIPRPEFRKHVAPTLLVLLLDEDMDVRCAAWNALVRICKVPDAILLALPIVQAGQTGAWRLRAGEC